MDGLPAIARLLIGAGAGLVLLGLLLLVAYRLGWSGRLPGDIVIERENVKIYFPIVTMIVLSILLTIVLNVIMRLKR